MLQVISYSAIIVWHLCAYSPLLNPSCSILPPPQTELSSPFSFSYQSQFLSGFLLEIGVLEPINGKLAVLPTDMMEMMDTLPKTPKDVEEPTVDCLSYDNDLETNLHGK